MGRGRERKIEERERETQKVGREMEGKMGER